MLFFLILGLTAAALLTLIILAIVTRSSELAGWAWGTPFLGAMAMMIAFMGAVVPDTNQTRILESQELSALPGAEDKFLSSAFVDGENVVSFVRNADGKPVFDSLDAVSVYEDETEPRWEKVQHYFYNGVWPWELSHWTEHILYVPEGSITENYTVGVDSK